MTIIGPPGREPDALADGYDWCACGLHAFPAYRTPKLHQLRTACPVCIDYDKPMPQAQQPHVATWMSDDSQRLPREAS